MKRLLLLLPLVLAGCSDTPQEVAQKLSSPQFIGQTEDGLLVKRYQIMVEGSTHYIYVFNSNSTVSVNAHIGKSHVVQVIVNGRSYILPEKP